MWNCRSTSCSLELVEPFPLLMLPDLVLQHVLTFMTRLERKAIRVTCLRLCKVASAAVTHFHLTAGISAGRHYLRLCERFPNVQVVSFSDQLASDAEFATLVVLALSRWKSLVAVDLQGTHLQLSAAGLCALLTCRHLKQLLLTPPASDTTLLPDAHTQAIIQTLSQLPSLTHLLLLPELPPVEAHAVPAPDWALGPPALDLLCQQHCLVQLELGCDSTLTSLSPLLVLTGLRQLSLRRLPRQAAGSMQQLSRLGALVSVSLSDSLLGDESLEAVGSLSALTELVLLGCPRLSEAFLHHLSPAQPLLVLRVPGLQVGELGLSALLAGPGPGLTKLEVDSVTTNTPGFHGHLPQLVHLGLARLTSATPQLSQLAPRLCSLVVTRGASDSGVTRALTGHAHLVRLGLCCDPLSDAGLASLTYLTQLTELGLVRAHLLGGERLTGVLGRLPQLKVLQLTEALELSDVVLGRIMVAAPQLEVLGLQECHLLSEEGWALLACLQHLQHLWMDACSGATPGVLTAVAACRSLACLEIHRLPGFTPHHLQLLGLVKGPKLDVLLHKGKRPLATILPLQPALGAASAGGVGLELGRRASDTGGLWRVGSLGPGAGDGVLEGGGMGGEAGVDVAAAAAAAAAAAHHHQQQQLEQQQQGGGGGGLGIHPGGQMQMQQLPQAFGALVLDAQGAAVQ